MDRDRQRQVDTDVYTLQFTGTPTSFVGRAGSDSARDSPIATGSPEPSRNTAKSAQPQQATTSTVAHSTPAAPTGKQVLPSGRPSQPVAAMMSFGPPVKLPPKLLNITPSATGGSEQQQQLAPGAPPVVHLDTDPDHKPRRWTKDTREFVNLGGRVIKVKTWWGGQDASFDPATEREKEEAAKEKAKSDAAKNKALAKQKAAAQDSSSAAAASDSRPSTPKPPAASTPASKANNATKKGEAKSAVPSPTPASTPTPAAAPPAAAPAVTGVADGTTMSSPAPASSSSPSRLPKPKFQPGGDATDWRGGAVGLKR